jgi:anaerobic magnesium-protoporphyrin IX monomethyl ester cyclase
MPFKILLIRPAALTGNAFSRVTGIMPPLNLIYLGSYLKQKAPDIHVSILDLELNPMNSLQLARKLNREKIDLVGITAHTNNMPAVAEISQIVKSVNPAIITIIGGPHPTVEPVKSLEYAKDVDFVACGEGEQILLELVLSLRLKDGQHRAVKGLYYRDDETRIVVFSGPRETLLDLTTIDKPDWNLVDIGAYLNQPQSPGIWKRTWNMFTQRGCAFDCSFCASPKIHAYKVRSLSITNVMAEITSAIRKYQITHVNFRDSNFTMDRKRTIALCLEMIKQNAGITWNCETRVNLVDRTLLKIMNAAGCSKISFGVESGSPRMLKRIDKKVTITQVRNAFGWCKDAGIKTQAFFMVGFPTESRLDIQATEALIKEIQPDFLFVSVVVPLPGTRIFQEFRDKNLITNADRYESFQFFFQAPAWRTLYFDVKTLVKIQRAVYSRYVISPRYIFRMVLQVRSWSQLRYYFSALLGFLEFLVTR